MKSPKDHQKNKCNTCKFCIDKECAHSSNIGVKVKYRTETPFFIKPIEELKKNCKNYEKV